MNTEKLMKSITIQQDALRVIKMTLLDENVGSESFDDDNLEIWKRLNVSINSLEEAKFIIHENKKK
jgi:predicted nucleic acid-binding protein